MTQRGRPDLAGRVVLVVGTGEETRVLALALAERGADIAVVAADAATAIDVAGELEGRGSRALALAHDVAQGPACDAAVARTLEEWGRIDFVISGVGLSAGALTSADVAAAFDRNCKGMLNLSRAFVGAFQRLRLRSQWRRASSDVTGAEAPVWRLAS